MMRKFMTVVMASIMLCVGGVATADPVSEVWNCVLKDGKTTDDAQATNSKWLAWARKVGGSDEITSSMGTSVVGDSGGFIWVDTFPDLATWAKVNEASSSDEYAPLGEAFEELQTCSGNRLWSSAATK
jgi:hypothetical protein